MIGFHRKKASTSEHGIALIAALFVLLLITAIGAGMVMMSNTETSISSNFRDEQVGLFCGEGRD